MWFKKFRGVFSAFLISCNICSSGTTLANSLDVSKDRVILVGNDMLVPGSENGDKLLCEGSVEDVVTQEKGVDLCEQPKQTHLKDEVEPNTLKALASLDDKKVLQKKASGSETADFFNYNKYTDASSEEATAQGKGSPIDAEANGKSKKDSLTCKDFLFLLIDILIYVELRCIFDQRVAAVLFIIFPNVFWYIYVFILNMRLISLIILDFLYSRYAVVFGDFLYESKGKSFDKIGAFIALRHAVVTAVDKIYKFRSPSILRKKLASILSYVNVVGERLLSVNDDLGFIENDPDCKEKYENCSKLLSKLSELCEKGFHVGHFDFLSWDFFGFLDEAISILEKLDGESSCFEQPQVVVISPFAQLNNIYIYDGMKIGKVEKKGIGQEKFNESLLKENKSSSMATIESVHAKIVPPYSMNGNW